METSRASKMGTWPINKLLLNMSVPLMISMLMQALYNVVDSYYVAQLNEAAVTSVTLAFPMQSLLIAVAVGIGVGTNALLSRSLGEKNQEGANRIAMQGIFLALAAYAVFALVGLFGSDGFAAVQTENAPIAADCAAYMRVCLCCSFGVFVQVIFERLLQATGRSVLSMVTQGVGAAVNIVLDPVFIFGRWGLPAMGVTGAAVATVIGQMVGALVGLALNLFCNRDIRLRWRNFVPHWHTLLRILYIGVPSMAMASIGAFMTFCMNLILSLRFSSTAVSVFGIYFKLQSFVFMPVFGLNNGMVPIVAYNLGARNRPRIVATIRLGAVYATGIMLLGLAALQLFPVPLLRLFNASDTMLAIGTAAFRIISLCYPLAGVSIVIISVCQALGKSVYGLFVSIGRQLVVLIPVAWLLSFMGNVNAVWWSFPIAEAVSLALCGLFLRRVLRLLDF